MQPDDTTPSSAVLRNAVRRHAALVLVCVVAGGLLGAGVSRALGQTYTSSSSIIVRPAVGNSLSPTTVAGTINQVTIAMETEVSLVTTPGVAAAAGKSAGTTLPAPSDKVRADVPPSTQIIEVTYTSPSRERAQEGSQAYAEAFLAFRADNAKRATDAQVASLTKQLDAANANLKQTSAQAASKTDPRSYSAQQLQLYAERVASLTNSISSAQSASQDPGEVIRPSQLAPGPNGLPSWFLVLIGAMLGGGFGLGLAVARVVRDDRIRTGDKTSVEGLPVLASTAAGSIVEVDASGASSTPEQDEAMRAIRTTVFADLKPGSVVAVSSVGPPLPTSSLGFSLASAIARAGFRSTLVNVDTRSPGVFDYSPDLDQSGVEVYAGPEGFDADDLASPRFRSLVDTLRQPDGYLILAVSPVGTASGDAAAAASDAVILVATEQRTTKKNLRMARTRLLSLGTAAIGFVTVTPGSRTSGSRGQRRGHRDTEPKVPAPEQLSGAHRDKGLPRSAETSARPSGSEQEPALERALRD